MAFLYIRYVSCAGIVFGSGLIQSLPLLAVFVSMCFSPVTVFFFSVPSWFGVRQREALRDSAAIAGLNVVALVHDNAAAALQHALDLEFVIKPENPKLPDASESVKNSTTASAADNKQQEDKMANNSTKTTSSSSSAQKKTKTESPTKPPTVPPIAAPPRVKVFFNVGSYATQVSRSRCTTTSLWSLFGC